MGRRIKRLGIACVEIASIAVPEEQQVSCQAEKVAAIVAAMERGVLMPRIEITGIGGGRYQLMDGLHRLEAVKLTGGTHIFARLVLTGIWGRG